MSVGIFKFGSTPPGTSLAAAATGAAGLIGNCDTESGIGSLPDCNWGRSEPSRSQHRRRRVSQGTPQPSRSKSLKDQVYESINRLVDWLNDNDYRGYDPFDGLNAKFLRPLTFNSKALRTVLQQGVRRFPINLRPLLELNAAGPQRAWAFWPELYYASITPQETLRGAIERNLLCNGW